jgi:beta-N-acetylhexosaminidase
MQIYMRFYIPIFIASILISWFSQGDGVKNQKGNNLNIESENQSKWVDSVFAALTPDQRIAQLFMVPAYSNKSLAENQGVTDLVSKYNIGGIIFFQGGPLSQARMTNYWQGISKTPLFIAIDGEWGLGMRLKDSTISFPKQMTLGAIQDNLLIYKMGEEIASQFKRLGIHINFAPVVDVNCNPRNPVINYRSFGESRENVALKGIAYMKGMQDKGILATAKHFPGHGDTDKDSHKTLPVINHGVALMDSVDLYPFRELIRNGLSSVMVAHLYVPAFDPEQSIATTLSHNVITGLLKEKMGFQGMVFTDALGMKGVTENTEPGQIEVMALQAGNDILLMSENVVVAIQAIKDAIIAGKLKQSDIDDRCKKILIYKYKAGLHHKQKVVLQNLYTDLHTQTSDWINRCLYEASVTIIKNDSAILPLRGLDSLRIACVSVGRAGKTDFQEMMDNYGKVSYFNLAADANSSSIATLASSLKDYNLVIIGLHSSSNSPSDNFGITASMIQAVKTIAAQNPVILDVFANPYSIDAFGSLENVKAAIVSYQDNELSQNAAAEAIFGGIAVDGRLPVTASSHFPLNAGFKTPKIRLKYTIPEDAGIDSKSLLKIDSIILKGIKDTIYPGCQVLIAVDGKVIYHKSFGYHTYDQTSPVKNSDLYDLASLTKIAATTISIMRLYEEGLINVDEKLVKYLPELDSSNKENIIIRELMAHQARLKPFIPFYKKTLIGELLDTNIYRKEKSAMFPYRVAENIYIRWDYPDTLFQAIINSDLRESSKYKYSDMGFYMLKMAIEKITNQTIDKYVLENFYKPLGLSTMCYQPRNYFDLSRIIPSEKDTFFRQQILQGDVNDPGAAMYGGIQGHAGLFSNSNDLAILLQMLIQSGEYGGERYYKQETVNEFTRYQYKDNRRGLGFDKPIQDRDGGPTCKAASDESFGHSGFTGTYVWADPKYDLVYVFLSNRTYPYSENNKLLESGIRTNIQSVIYSAISVRDMN